MQKKLFLNIVSQSVLKGYRPFKKQPTFKLELSINTQTLNKYSNKDLSYFNNFISTNFKSYSYTINHKESILYNIESILKLFIETLYTMTNVPLIDSIEWNKISSVLDKNIKIEFCIPLLFDTANIKYTILFIVNMLNLSMEKFDLNTQIKKFETLLNSILSISPKGVNALRLIESANQLNIPWRYITPTIYQFGWGSNSELFSSSISSSTSAIGFNISENKLSTHQFLMISGIPSLEKYSIKSEDDALKRALKIGYPVVIKPNSLNRGQGVTANIRTPQILLKAYQKAKALSNSIIMEKHFEGKDYRLHLCKHNLYYATNREAAKVRGDGNSSINKLITKLNKKRENDPLLQQIKIDEETSDYINEQGYELHSKLKKGEIVYLGRIANVSTGGNYTEIKDFSNIHPDNIELAKRVSQILRLDICAVDFLSPDISKSWLEAGGVICEVNAKPQIGSKRALEYLLKSFVKDDGRVPTIGFVGERDTQMLQSLVDTLISHNKNIGICSKDGVKINNKLVSNNYTTLFDNSLVLVSNPMIDLIILVIEDFYDLDNGLAVDRFDYLILSKETNIGEYLTIAQTILTTQNYQKYLDNIEQKNNIVIASHQEIINYISDGI